MSVFPIVFNSFFLLDFLLCQVVPIFFFEKSGGVGLFADDLRWFVFCLLRHIVIGEGV